MKIIKDSPKVKFTGGESKRIIIKSDNMGFGICETHIDKGGPYHWHYKNHLEACYCISGNGTIKNLDTGDIFNISKGITYLLDKNDNHEFKAITKVKLISIFNPPLAGNETHDKNGNYDSSI